MAEIADKIGGYVTSLQP